MKYGLIGEKLPHSYSKIIHEMLGRYEYELCPMSEEEMREAMAEAIRRKPRCHGELSAARRSQAARNMNQIGG